MTSSTLTRAGFLASVAAAAIALTVPAAEARRDAAAEQYVQVHVSEAMRALADSSQSPAQRQREFSRLMARFSDLSGISLTVLGAPYDRQVAANPQLRTEWMQTFQEFAFATYEYQFDRYRGNSVRVVDSTVIHPTQRVEVTTEISGSGRGRPFRAKWRLRREGEGWKVYNVAQISGEQVIWLADFQRDVFRSILDQNHDDMNALIAHVRTQTASMRAQESASR